MYVPGAKACMYRGGEGKTPVIKACDLVQRLTDCLRAREIELESKCDDQKSNSNKALTYVTYAV